MEYIHDTGFLSTGVHIETRRESVCLHKRGHVFAYVLPSARGAMMDLSGERAEEASRLFLAGEDDQARAMRDDAEAIMTRALSEACKVEQQSIEITYDALAEVMVFLCDLCDEFRDAYERAVKRHGSEVAALAHGDEK